MGVGEDGPLGRVQHKGRARGRALGAHLPRLRIVWVHLAGEHCRTRRNRGPPGRCGLGAGASGQPLVASRTPCPLGVWQLMLYSFVSTFKHRAQSPCLPPELPSDFDAGRGHSHGRGLVLGRLRGAIMGPQVVRLLRGRPRLLSHLEEIYVTKTHIKDPRPAGNLRPHTPNSRHQQQHRRNHRGQNPVPPRSPSWRKYAICVPIFTSASVAR